jgi:nitric oxide reductase subunit B
MDLLAVAIATFAVLGWTTKLTYRAAPPLPNRITEPDGRVLISAADLVAGKTGFQRTDLMDYGSLYGMGSYFGEDYTAGNLVRLANPDRRQHRPGQDRQGVRRPCANR